MKLVLLGPPGAGKGTQAEQLAKKYNIPAISTGHLIRTAIAAKTPVGVEAKTFIDRGELVPDSMVVEMVKERIKEEDCKNGYILDGFPRTVAQAEVIEQIPIEIDLVLEFDVSEDEIVARLSGRRECKNCGATYHLQNKPPVVDGVCDKCGTTLTCRDDDVPEIIRHRIGVYNELTSPLKDFYADRNLLASISGCNTVAETTEAVMQTIKERIVEAGV